MFLRTGPSGMRRLLRLSYLSPNLGTVMELQSTGLDLVADFALSTPTHSAQPIMTAHSLPCFPCTLIISPFP